MSFFKKLLVAWVVDVLALGAAVVIFNGVYGSFFSVVAAAVVYALLNTFLKPVLKLATLMLAIVTLGLAWFGVAMAILWFTSKIVTGFHIHGFFTLIGATIVVWIVGHPVSHFLFRHERAKGFRD
jgi:putative membrane protein